MTTKSGEGWTLYNGDSAEVLAGFPENSLEVCITDPPYFLGAEPDVCALIAAWLAGKEYKLGRGFMSNEWDGYLPGPRIWREVYRVLKPGAHVLAFGGPRTFDLLTLALRLSGFEIRDALAWLYGSGFPKSLNVAKALRAAGNEAAAEAWDGFGTALKPAWEPIILARKPLSGTVCANVLARGTGALNLDAARIPAEPWSKNVNTSRELGAPDWTNEGLRFGLRIVEKHSNEAGRFPANVLLDEEAAAELDKQAPGNSRFFYTAKAHKSEREAGLDAHELKPAGGMEGRRDGSLGGEPVRRKNAHPTVKPIDLMEYIIALATPPGGTVLDPFNGSGSTGCAALRSGFDYIGIELSPEYFETSAGRLAHFSFDNFMR